MSVCEASDGDMSKLSSDFQMMTFKGVECSTQIQKCYHSLESFKLPSYGLIEDFDYVEPLTVVDNDIINMRVVLKGKVLNVHRKLDNLQREYIKFKQSIEQAQKYEYKFLMNLKKLNDKKEGQKELIDRKRKLVEEKIGYRLEQMEVQASMLDSSKKLRLSRLGHTSLDDLKALVADPF